MRTCLMTFVWILVFCAPRSALAEPLDSDTLRVEKSWHFFWGIRNKIISGDEELFTLGKFPSRAPAALFEERSVDASQLYLKYRRLESSSSWMAIGGMTLFSIGIVVGLDTEHEDLGGGLILGSLAVMLGSMVVSTIADMKLRESVAVYNRSEKTDRAHQPLLPAGSKRRK